MTQTALDKVLIKVKKEYGKVVWEVNDLPDYNVVPTGLLSLDRALGTGGWPCGHYNMIFGPEGGGKTTVSYASIGQCTRMGKEALFIASEPKIDREYMRRCIKAQGGNPDLVHVVAALKDDDDHQPVLSGEAALQIIINATGSCKLIVLDSIAALATQKELDSEVVDHHVAIQARMIGRFLKMHTSRLAVSDTAILFTNQIRVGGIGSGRVFDTTPGGKAIKHATTMRVRINRKGTPRVEDGVKVGQTHICTVHKNQLSPGWRTLEFFLRWGEGVSVSGDLAEACKHLGIIELKGSNHYHHSWEGPINGKASIERYLTEHRDVFDILDQEIREALDTTQSRDRMEAL